MTKYVQHISGQGEKWEVNDTYMDQIEWCVYSQAERLGFHYLPKSEYRECPSPQKWVECTRGAVTITPNGDRLYPAGTPTFLTCGTIGILHDGYRWAWKGDALVIERREEA